MRIADFQFDVTFKDIRHLHLSVNPPDGQVRVSAPYGISEDIIRFAVTKRLRWIRSQQMGFAKTSRQSQREAISGESHYLWGKRFVLEVLHHSSKPSVRTRGNSLILSVRSDLSKAKRLQSLDDWYREQLRTTVDAMICEWAPLLGRSVNGVRLRKMKTKWGSCNSETGTLTLNTQLVSKTPQLVEYVVVHELVHLVAKGHGKDFSEAMDGLLPDWKQRQQLLNATVHGSVVWRGALPNLENNGVSNHN